MTDFLPRQILYTVNIIAYSCNAHYGLGRHSILIKNLKGFIIVRPAASLMLCKLPSDSHDYCANCLIVWYFGGSDVQPHYIRHQNVINLLLPANIPPKMVPLRFGRHRSDCRLLQSCVPFSRSHSMCACEDILKHIQSQQMPQPGNSVLCWRYYECADGYYYTHTSSSSGRSASSFRHQEVADMWHLYAWWLVC